MNVGSIEASQNLAEKSDRQLVKLMAKIDRAKAILAEYPMQNRPVKQQDLRALPGNMNA